MHTFAFIIIVDAFSKLQIMEHHKQVSTVFIVLNAKLKV